MNSRHFGRTLPIPSTLQILHDLLVFSAEEQDKRDRLADTDLIVGVLKSTEAIVPTATVSQP